MAHAFAVNLLYQLLVRPLLFLLSAETAHRAAALVLGLLHRSVALRRLVAAATPPDVLAVDVFGIRFASPVGIAAGFDKAANLYNGLGALGFSFVEVGTVTARPQPGNPRPRLFRLPSDRALINRMGFNNPGAVAAAQAISDHPPHGVLLGVNIGKSKTTPLESAAEDYSESAAALVGVAKYVAINVSSPNTPGLRSLQSIDALREIIAAVRPQIGTRPLLVKIAPDLADEEIDAIADLALEAKLAGIIAVNTTVAREGLGLRTPSSRIAAIGNGGLSGPPLRERALGVVRRIYQRTAGALVIVAVGGIETPDDAWAAIRAGATLVQVYTAFVFGGPTLPRRLIEGLHARLRASTYANMNEAIGSEHGRDAVGVESSDRVSGVLARSRS